MQWRQFYLLADSLSEIDRSFIMNQNDTQQLSLVTVPLFTYFTGLLSVKKKKKESGNLMKEDFFFVGFSST